MKKEFKPQVVKIDLKFFIILEEKYPAVKIRANKIRVGENF